MDLLLRRPSFSRRQTSRVETMEGVSVYWRCNGHEDVSRVRDLGFGGLFIETRTQRPVGAEATIGFLVQEGQITANAIVRHVRPSGGLGLKFTAIPWKDRLRLGMLIARLRHFDRPVQVGELAPIEESRSPAPGIPSGPVTPRQSGSLRQTG